MSIYPTPNENEKRVAAIISRHFKTSVAFIPVRNNFKQKTPDIEFLSIEWEIKTPIGTSRKTTIRKAIKNGSKQSKYIIIDGSLCKTPDNKIIEDIKREISKSRTLKRLIYIKKDSSVIELLFKN